MRIGEAVACFKVNPHHSPDGKEENHENLLLV
jgi:hypothetical protein